MMNFSLSALISKQLLVRRDVFFVIFASYVI